MTFRDYQIPEDEPISKYVEINPYRPAIVPSTLEQFLDLYVDKLLRDSARDDIKDILSRVVLSDLK